MKTRIKTSLPALLACFIIIIALTIFLWTTKFGIGIHGDSTAYLGTAINLLKGNGFVFGERPMTDYAPFYPMVLAISGFFNPDLFVAARWLHAVLYVTNAMLFAGIFYCITKRNLLAAGLASLIFITSKTVIYVHTRAWSEPLFITLTFSACLLFARYFVTPKWKYLLYGSIFCSLAVLTRYVGLALIPAVALCILLLTPRPIKDRFIALLVSASISIAPMAVWAARNMLINQSNDEKARALLIHPRPITRLGRQLTSLFYNFIFPAEGSKYLTAAVIGLILLFLIILLVILWKNRELYLNKYRYETCLLCLTGLISISYIVTVIGSITFVDAAIPISERIFIPALLLITIFVFSTLFLFPWLNKRGWFYWVSIGLMVLFIYFNIPETRTFAQDLHDKGIEYNEVKWKNSATLNAVRELDSEPLLYSNGSDVIILMTGRQAVSFPQRFSKRLGLANPNYQQELEDMCDDVRNGDALIVWLPDILRSHLTVYEELVDICHLPYQIEFDDGVILGGVTPE